MTLLLGALTAACGGDKGYEITLDIEGLGSRGIEMVTVGSREMARQPLHPVDGKVTAEGKSVDPVLIEIMPLDGGEPLVSFVASDGDRIQVKMNLAEGRKSLEIKGRDDMERYGRWMAENDSLLTRGSDDEVNLAIVREVEQNRASLSSALIVATQFRAVGHEVKADSVFNLIPPAQRPASIVSAFTTALGTQTSIDANASLRGFTLPNGVDSAMRYVPSKPGYTLLAFFDSRKPDSLSQRLKELRKHMPRQRFRILEIGLQRDSAMWRAQLSGDSARWAQAWAAGGVASGQLRRMAIPTTPFFILADSLGHQEYRGRNLWEADAVCTRVLGTTNENPDDTTATVSEPKPVPTPEVKQEPTQAPKPQPASTKPRGLVRPNPNALAQ